MALTTRGQLIEPTDTVQLVSVYKDGSGNPVDPDLVPMVTILDPSGLVVVGPTSAGVMKIDTGKYQFDYNVNITNYGVFTDVWSAIINGFRVQSSFNFIVSHTDLPAINTDGYIHLGDLVGFDFDQQAMFNVNKLLQMLKARLRSSGKVKSTDGYGNVQFISCDIYSVDVLTNFLCTALSEFNQTPYFTFFQFSESWFVNQFAAILVEGAAIYALASQALLERGREYQISDNGIQFTPPTMSELLNTQWSTTLTQYNEKLKYIKASLRPAPKGLGNYTMTNGANPAWIRLRHLRERKLI